MPPEVIFRTESLTKRFGGFTAVDGVDIEVRRGDIYGFLGLNGAGKTTTIRMALNLIRPTSGGVYFDGIDVRRNHKKVMSQVGALVEIPALYLNLSARDNLRIFGLLCGGVERARIDRLLELFGLKARAKDKVRTYSQGMRQRLGIAQALLHSPRLVMLDEPTNGLDPQGILDVRDMIRRMNREEGVSFMISSHLLHEMEMICNRIGIIRQGKMLSQGPLDELLSKGPGRVSIKASQADKAKAAIESSRLCKLVSSDGGRFVVEAAAADLAQLNAELCSKRISVSEFAPQRMGLEEYFEKAMRG